MRDFRFGYNVRGLGTAADLAVDARRAEAFGYDVALVPDHLGGPSPFVTAQALADATDGLRVGTLVLNNGFWNPHLLAREVASVDRLSGGRFELGLGSGHMKWEFDAAGIAWEPFRERSARLAATIATLGRIFADPMYAERADLHEQHGIPVLEPVQRTGFGGSGPPLLVGGTGDTVLEIAAAHADTVAVAGVFQAPGEPPGTFRLGTAAQAAERVAFVRDRLGGRDAELSMLLQRVTLTGDRRAAAEETARLLPYLSVDEILETPFLAFGTPEQIAAQLRAHREEYGFSYVTVHGPFMEHLGPAIELLR
ncbi:TIGR03621 family F420-dependent LLM class oxidoreductase [Actinomadura flavalba]|uniref:TIGR03621 family F420-dependent LLM class oxidoreductase n=1 Tax=Actinomadura flavalba TaxID=1120938 RepID=UPI000360F5CC|nr:TIGR03621 family F420-dependent LLM class oxidoreductase [Actinomadura flavalba]